jgi:hypothetical protein
MKRMWWWCLWEDVVDACVGPGCLVSAGPRFALEARLDLRALLLCAYLAGVRRQTIWRREGVVVRKVVAVLREAGVATALFVVVHVWVGESTPSVKKKRVQGNCWSEQGHKKRAWRQTLLRSAALFDSGHPCISARRAISVRSVWRGVGTAQLACCSFRWAREKIKDKKITFVNLPARSRSTNLLACL